MLPPKARWIVRSADPEVVRTLMEEMKLAPLAAALMAARGITSAEEGEAYLSQAATLHDPMLLDGMEAGVTRIRQAVAAGERIRIYGDYDADGVSSTSLMIGLMKILSANYDAYIPHRVNEGYGLNLEAIEEAAEAGVDLIVTVDNGISACEQIAYAVDLGMDVVVTDHHEPPEILPEGAVALINPKKPGCPYPFKGLAGVGVALKLAQALLGEVPEHFYQWAALGTIADLMPLLGENRGIVKRGLASLRENPLPGLRALFEVAGAPVREASAGHIGFAIAPRVNASGRLEHANEAVRLLTAESKEDAAPIAESLDRLNTQRQQMVETIFQDALDRLGDQPKHEVIVISDPDWNVGVLGIVASKLLERFYRPVIVLSDDPKTGLSKGSARSIPGYDIYKALRACEDVLEHYGGHEAAAGMTLQTAKLNELRERLHELALQWLTPQDRIPVMHADGHGELAQVTVEAIEQIERMAPFGNGNPTPRVVLEGLRISEVRTFGKEGQHLKLTLMQEDQQAGKPIDAVAFGAGDLFEEIAPTSRVDLLGELNMNEWNGMRKPQVLIKDLRIPHVQVFDWRGRKDADAHLMRRLPQGGEPGRYGLLLFTPWTGEEIRAGMRTSGCGIWLYDGGQIRSLDQGYSADEVQVLYLYAVPPAADDLTEALRAFPNLRKVYVLFRQHDSLSAGAPNREMVKTAYVGMKQLARWDAAAPGWIGQLSRKTGLSERMIRTMLQIFEELAFVEKREGEYHMAANPGKTELDASPTFRGLKRSVEAEAFWLEKSAEDIAEWIRSACEKDVAGTNGFEKDLIAESYLK